MSEDVKFDSDKIGKWMYFFNFIGNCLFCSIVDEKCPLKSGHGKQTV